MSKITYKDLASYKLDVSKAVAAMTISKDGNKTDGAEMTAGIIQSMVYTVMNFRPLEGRDINSQVIEPDFLLAWNTLSDPSLGLFVKIN